MTMYQHYREREENRASIYGKHDRAHETRLSIALPEKIELQGSEKILDLETGMRYESTSQAVMITGLSRNQIYYCCKKRIGRFRYCGGQSSVKA